MFTITIKNDGNGTIMHTKGENCNRLDIVEAAEDTFISLLMGMLRKNLTSKEQEETAKKVGMEVEERLLNALRGDRKIQSVFGKDAAFLHELMKRQGEVQG